MATLTFIRQTRAAALHASSDLALWRAVLLALLIIGMLIAFHSVVSRAMRDGELRRQSHAALASALHSCKTLPEPASGKCQKELLAHAAGADATQLAQLLPAPGSQAD